MTVGTWHLVLSTDSRQGQWLGEGGGSVAIFRNFAPHLIILREVDTVSLV